MLYLKSIPANCYKHPLSLCLFILFIAEALRWCTDFANDKVFVIGIFMFMSFLFNRIGKKLRRIDEAANELCQDLDKGYTQTENTPRQLEPISNQALSPWWG